MGGLKVFILMAALACAAPAFASEPLSSPLPESCSGPDARHVQFSGSLTREKIEAIRKRVQSDILKLRARRACLSAALDRLRIVWKDAVIAGKAVPAQSNMTEVTQTRGDDLNSLLGQYNTTLSPDSPLRVVGRDAQPSDMVEERVAEVREDMLRTIYERGSAFNDVVRRYDATLPSGSPLAEAELDISGVDAPPPQGTPGSIPRPGLLSLPSRVVWSTHDCPGLDKAVPDGVHTEVSFTYDLTETGAATNVAVTASSGILDLDAAVVACVTARWHDEPAIRNGVPVYSVGYPGSMTFSTLATTAVAVP